MDKICQIISRSRSLDDDTLPLFLQPDLSELRLYDCSRLHTDNIEQIAYITPNLSTLQLSFCGRLIDSTLTQIVSRLNSLQHLILIGPFLITTGTWKSALETMGRKLRTFEISDTARWDESCSKTLVDKCPNLEVVGFKRINGLSDSSVQWLSKLKNLKSLDLTEPVGKVTDESIVPIVRNTGAKLEKLVLDGCVDLGDKTFQAIIQYCSNLHHLSLALLDKITEESVVKGFKSWTKNHGLLRLNLSRCVGIKDAGVQAILAHSGASLEWLSLNSLDELTQETFKLFLDELGNIGKGLVELDVGFVRCVNDDLVYGLSNACKELRVLKVFPLGLRLLILGVWKQLCDSLFGSEKWS
jgi:DNA repair protein RAD7